MFKDCGLVVCSKGALYLSPSLILIETLSSRNKQIGSCFGQSVRGNDRLVGNDNAFFPLSFSSSFFKDLFFFHFLFGGGGGVAPLVSTSK